MKWRVYKQYSCFSCVSTYPTRVFTLQYKFSATDKYALQTFASLRLHISQCSHYCAGFCVATSNVQSNQTLPTTRTCESFDGLEYVELLRYSLGGHILPTGVIYAICRYCQVIVSLDVSTCMDHTESLQFITISLI